MKPMTKLQLILGIGGPIAVIVGFGIGYGLGKICCCIYDKIDDYFYYKKKGL